MHEKVPGSTDTIPIAKLFILENNDNNQRGNRGYHDIMDSDKRVISSLFYSIHIDRQVIPASVVLDQSHTVAGSFQTTLHLIMQFSSVSDYGTEARDKGGRISLTLRYLRCSAACFTIQAPQGNKFCLPSLSRIGKFYFHLSILHFSVCSPRTSGHIYLILNGSKSLLIIVFSSNHMGCLEVSKYVRCMQLLRFVRLVGFRSGTLHFTPPTKSDVYQQPRVCKVSAPSNERLSIILGNFFSPPISTSSHAVSS